MYNVQCNLTFAGTCSIITLVFIAYDRYHVIVYGIAHADQRITTRKAALIIAFIWIYSVVACIPPFFGWGGYKLGNSTYRASRMLHLCTLHLWMLHLRKLSLLDTFGKLHILVVSPSEFTPSDVSPSGNYTYGTLQLRKITPFKFLKTSEGKKSKGVTFRR